MTDLRVIGRSSRRRVAQEAVGDQRLDTRERCAFHFRRHTWSLCVSSFQIRFQFAHTNVAAQDGIQ